MWLGFECAFCACAGGYYGCIGTGGEGERAVFGLDRAFGGFESDGHVLLANITDGMVVRVVVGCARVHLRALCASIGTPNKSIPPGSPAFAFQQLQQLATKSATRNAECFDFQALNRVGQLVGYRCLASLRSST